MSLQLALQHYDCQSGLQNWPKLQPFWVTDQSSEASLSLASDHRNAAHWRRTCQNLVGGSFLEASFTSLTNVLFRNSFALDETCICICVLFFVDELKEKLQDFVSETNSQRPGFIKVVRHAKQEGLIRSRVSGWRATTAPVVALFDAHVEFNVGW